MRGRVDAVIGYRLDVENAEKELGIEGLFFETSLPLYTAEEAFVCRDSTQHRKLFERINPIIASFK